MARFEFGKNTIRGELIRLLILSLLIGVAVNLITDHCGSAIADYYLRHSDYLEEHDRQYIASLQDYIDENRLAGTDQEGLYAWTKENNDVLLYIFDQDDEIAFLSYNFGSKVYSTDVSTQFLDQMNEYKLHFSDGYYYAFLFGTYAYRPYTFFFVASVACGVIAFLVIFLIGIRRKMRYIAGLKEEVDILSGGDLDYEITVEGSDELAELADHLNQMRVLLLQHIEEEARMTEEHRSIMNRLSHDIRTPLTTITLYSELLLQKKYQDAAQREHLLHRIHSSAEHMGNLAEQLSAQAKEQGVPQSRHLPADADVLQALPEMAEELRMQGYSVEESYQQGQRAIPVNGEALARILDNILSNILRYADSGIPVTIVAKQADHERTEILFSNFVKAGEAKDAAHDETAPEFAAPSAPSEESIASGAGIGLQSIRTQMQKLGGSVRIERRDDQFLIRLLFPS